MVNNDVAPEPMPKWMLNGAVILFLPLLLPLFMSIVLLVDSYIISLWEWPLSLITKLFVISPFFLMLYVASRLPPSGK